MRNQRSNPFSRPLLRCTLLLLSGASTSVAIAWSIEIIRAYRDSKFHYPSWTLSPHPPAAVLKDPQEPDSTLLCYRDITLGRTNWFISRVYLEFDMPTCGRLPGWTIAPPRADHAMATTCAFGLPFRCLTHATTAYAEGPPEEAYLNMLRSRPIPNSAFIAELPLRPILQNLLLNTLFYASLFTLPLTIKPFRRHLRSRRGHCPHCNYNLLHNFSHPCPECGRLPPASTEPRPSGSGTLRQPTAAIPHRTPPPPFSQGEVPHWRRRGLRPLHSSAKPPFA